ncbi:MAG: 2,3-butanediol dehydrogenase [Comamonadaceae bacterium]|nr:MAG: 2,3-butanediol dehydrogenase [Comamonadaceae bacterium]
MTNSAMAVRWHGAGDVRLESVSIASPGPGEVLIRCAYCGACGSDVHEIHDGPHAIPTQSPHLLSGATAPLTLGHEFSGTVTEIGSGVPGLDVGDPVVIEPSYRCGDCEACRADRYHLCRGFGFAGLMGDGGMAEQAVVPAYMVHRLPNGFDLAQAAILEPAAVALHAVRRSGLVKGDSAAVIGLGPVGLLITALLALRGIDPIIGVDPIADRRDKALSSGATIAMDPMAQPDATPDVRRLAGGTGVDVAFEVVGAQASFDIALEATRAGGRIVLLGLTGRLEFDAMSLVNTEVSIVTSVGYNDCHRELIDLVHTGRLNLKPFTDDVVPLMQAPQILQAMASGDVRGIKTLVDCGANAR